MLAFAFVVLELSVIHDTANGRTLVRSDFDQIEAGFSCLGERLFCGNDSKLRAVDADDADGGDADLIVYPGLNSLDDGGFPFI